MNFVYTPQEMFAIGIVIALVEVVKPYIDKGFCRFIPFPIAAGLAVCIVIESAGGWPGWIMLAAQGIQVTLKIAFAAMGLFDLVLKKNKQAKKADAVCVSCKKGERGSGD